MRHSNSHTKASSLFREEVLSSRASNWMGAIRVAQPISAWLIVGSSLTIALALLLFASVGEMTKKARVAGVLLPVGGSITIAAPNTALLISTQVQEGQQVAAGQVLFTLSTERQNKQGEITALVAQQLATRQASLESEKRTRQNQYQDKLYALKQQLVNSGQEEQQLTQEIKLAEQRQNLAQVSVEKFAALSKNGYVSGAQLQQKQEDLLDMTSRVSTDGLMALLALGMMLLYSVKLSALVFVAVLLYAGLRWAFYGVFREASQERLVLASKESSHFLETVRAIAPLKLFGRESERLARWQNLKMDVQNRDVKTQKLGILFKVSNTTIFGIQGLAMFYVGAGQVMENALTVGMLMAFSSYAGTFTGRISGLIDLFINVKMLSLHSERLADIVLEEAEPEVLTETDTSRLEASITIKNLKFRYAEGEPWVLNGINLMIPAGQSIALVGPSGCGKTTLCKIILGLLKPTEGEVLIDQIPITQLGHRAYRQLVGTLMQEDVLLAGSILDNISFFDSHSEQNQVEHAAKLAAIHDEIAKMPMGYQTLVGDMGSSLSGGQKQRVLLAKALYKQPKILALDEATSHLDIANEQKVNQAISDLSLTRIMVAHRPETIRAAQRVVAIENGLVVEVRAAEPFFVTEAAA